MNENIFKLQQKNIKKRHSRALFYIGMALFLASIFVRNVFELNIPVAIILGIAALIALISDRDEMIALVVCCVPTSAAFQYKYLIFICIIIWIIKFGKEIKNTRVMLPLLLMMAWELLHGLFYPFSIYEFLRGFAELIFIALVLMTTPKKMDYKLICRALAIVSICMMLIVLLNLLQQTNYDFEAIFEGTYRFGVGDSDAEQYGVNYNANGLAMIVLISVTALLQLIVAKKQNLFDYVMIIVLILFGIMTTSRAFLLCFVGLILLFAVSGANSITAKLKRIFLIVLLVVILVLLVINLMPSVYENYVARFEEDDITGGRSSLFTSYSEYIFSSPQSLLFGVGIYDYSGIVNAKYNVADLVCHNGTQELVVCWGLPGIALFAWFVGELIRSKPQGLKRKLANYTSLITLLVFVQSIQLLTSGQALLALLVAYVGLSSDLNPDSVEKEK